ncbi:MAG: DUF3488 and transglutaminase-like domain-containing protein [Synergistaceae bacterium]|nr:DUF3488 and transglutaminase-like domain-containing protein [Synergistaceae bacterium]
MALIAVILSQFRRNYIIEPFMEVILAMTAVKMLEKKSARDYMQLLLLSLMMLICYAMIYLDKEFVLYCFGQGIISIFIMTLCSWQTKEPHAAISLSNLTQLFYRLISIFAMMLPLCVLMFIIAPRIRSPFFGVFGTQGISQVGFSDQVVLGGVSEVQKNNKLAFRAEMPQQPLTPYWRGVALDMFDGRMWIASQSSMRLRHVFTNEKAVRQEVYLEPGRRRYLFAMDTPVSVSNVQAQINANGIIIYNGINDGRRLQYSAVSVSSAAMRMDSTNFNKRRYLALPPDFIPRLKFEVERITEGLGHAQKISAILNYLSPPNYEYALTDMPNTPNALEHFLFVSKKGNCEFFASAMGVMLRMAGIPARLVGGYKGGMYNDAGGYYAVFEEYAHVWVESWDEERFSWMRHDPTPYSPFDGSDLENYGFWEAYLDLLDYQWIKFVLNYNLELQGEVFSSVRNIINNPGSLDFSGFAIERLPLAAGVIVAIILGLYFIRRTMKRNAGETLARKFISIMKRKGFDKHKSEGLREFSSRLPEREKIKAMAFVERFEVFYYKEKEFDKAAVGILKERLKRIADSD